MLVSVLSAIVVGALGHGALSTPRPRNAIDGSLSPWNGSVPEVVPFMFWCATPDAWSGDPRGVSGANGQVSSDSHGIPPVNSHNNMQITDKCNRHAFGSQTAVRSVAHHVTAALEGQSRDLAAGFRSQITRTQRSALRWGCRRAVGRRHQRQCAHAQVGPRTATRPPAR